MFQKLVPLLILSAALPSLALARDPAVAEQRDATKDARQHAREVERLARKWTRAAEKGKADKVAELDPEVRALANTELARLRGLGVATKPDAPVPGQPGKHHPYERPGMERLRDDLVELRGLVAGRTEPGEVDRAALLLDRVAASAEARREVAERALDRVKART